MAQGRHLYEVSVEWTGNRGEGTSGYRAYGREHSIRAGSKPEIAGSSDPAYRGDAARWNPEELLVAAVGLPPGTDLEVPLSGVARQGPLCGRSAVTALDPFAAVAPNEFSGTITQWVKLLEPVSRQHRAGGCRSNHEEH
jgi:hypothetical protein